jgi:8-oxo-dGTP pyrophosphatase MutT (NUDIX family)
MQGYWRYTRSLTMGAQGVVFSEDEKVLLVRHTYRPGWHFPGGGVEKNETALTALKRELSEEAGITIEAPPRLIGLYANFESFPSDHVALFHVAEWSRPSIPAPNNEIAESGFFAYDALPDGTTMAVRRRLDEITGRAAPIEQW